MLKPRLSAFPEHTLMIPTLLFAGLLIVIVAVKYLHKPAERCPDCGRAREGDHPICDCGWVYEYPDDGEPLEYGDPDEDP
ncbi:MAG: hypothetical protein QGI83_04630 [Candidatus Latescibacteria bacterium]|nr:hypothetical protein [Candidatus Latescibacterota bacterium]